jgi:hypothetical protein
MLGRDTRNTFLVTHQWRGAEKDAGVVQAAGTATLAVGAIREIARCAEIIGIS